MAFPATDPASGAIDQGGPALYTPDQLRRLRLTLSRSPFYTEADYFLRFLVVNSVVGQVVQIRVRFEDLQGSRKHQTINITPTADRAVNAFQTYLGEGLLFGVSAACTGSSVDVGTCWVFAELMQGD